MITRSNRLHNNDNDVDVDEASAKESNQHTHINTYESRVELLHSLSADFVICVCGLNAYKSTLSSFKITSSNYYTDKCNKRLLPGC